MSLNWMFFSKFLQLSLISMLSAAQHASTCSSSHLLKFLCATTAFYFFVPNEDFKFRACPPSAIDGVKRSF